MMGSKPGRTCRTGRRGRAGAAELPASWGSCRRDPPEGPPAVRTRPCPAVPPPRPRSPHCSTHLPHGAPFLSLFPSLCACLSLSPFCLCLSLCVCVRACALAAPHAVSFAVTLSSSCQRHPSLIVLQLLAPSPYPPPSVSLLCVGTCACSG